MIIIIIMWMMMKLERNPEKSYGAPCHPGKKQNRSIIDVFSRVNQVREVRGWTGKAKSKLASLDG